MGVQVVRTPPPPSPSSDPVESISVNGGFGSKADTSFMLTVQPRAYDVVIRRGPPIDIAQGGWFGVSYSEFEEFCKAGLEMVAQHREGKRK